MIAAELGKLSVSSLHAAMIDPAAVLELELNVSWSEALKYMVSHHISAVPLKEAGKYLGYIDRFTFVHWAAQQTKAMIDAARGTGELAPTPEAIQQKIYQEFTTKPLTQMDRSCFHPVTMLDEESSAMAVADILRRPGVYRVYLTRKGAICGVITQHKFFSWLVSQPFVTSCPAYSNACIQHLVQATGTEYGKTKASYAARDLKTHAYEAIACLKRHPSDAGLSDASVMLGEDGSLITVVRRRDIDVIAKHDALHLLCEPFNRFISQARNDEVHCTVASIIVHLDTPVDAVARRLAAARFEHAFVMPRGCTLWAELQDIITDGRILRFVLALK